MFLDNSVVSINYTKNDKNLLQCLIVAWTYKEAIILNLKI